MQLHDLTLTELAAGLAAKRFSSREIVDALHGRIAKANDKLHAFTEVYAAEAKALAQAADTARASGFPLGPLHGLPVAYKDLCDIAGKVGTGGSKMFEKRVATETSNTVERLTAAGMVPLGKLHMVEFAFGGWGTNPLMGAPWNPWDLKTHRVPGGSSSAGRNRQRHRWFGAHSLSLQRSCWPEGDIRPDRALRNHSAELVARFD